jgi:MFS family permease
VGSITGGRWSDYVFVRNATKHGGQLEAEDRFGINTWVGAILYPLGILIYGWTIDKGLFVVVPEIGTFLFGLGMMIAFSTTTTYLIDAVPGRSSSAVAMNNLVRNILAAVGTIIGKPLIVALGNGVLFSILAGVGLVSSGFIWAIIKVLYHFPEMLRYSGEVSGGIHMIFQNFEDTKSRLHEYPEVQSTTNSEKTTLFCSSVSWEETGTRRSRLMA